MGQRIHPILRKKERRKGKKRDKNVLLEETRETSKEALTEFREDFTYHLRWCGHQNHRPDGKKLKVK